MLARVNQIYNMYYYKIFNFILLASIGFRKILSYHQIIIQKKKQKFNIFCFGFCLDNGLIQVEDT